MIWAIGDVHGNTPAYDAILRRLHHEDPDAVTFQVGDMGVGFRRVPFPHCGPNDFFIAGNHDDALLCQKVPGFLGDFGTKDVHGKRVFYLGGALSTDRAHRTEGVDWWPYEELTEAQFAQAAAVYEDYCPDIVITHDCPNPVRHDWFGFRDGGPTVTALTRLFETWQPQFWCFGHHHHHKMSRVNGTYFIALSELQNKIVKEPRPFED